MSKEDIFKKKLKELRTDEEIKHRRWSDEEDLFLMDAFYRGLGISLIAMKLNRTERAVFSRVQKLKLYPRKHKTST